MGDARHVPEGCKMATRRVNGLIYVPCPGCGRKLGPFTGITGGLMKCGHCGRQFNVTV